MNDIAAPTELIGIHFDTAIRALSTKIFRLQEQFAIFVLKPYVPLLRKTLETMFGTSVGRNFSDVYCRMARYPCRRMPAGSNGFYSAQFQKL
jgi:hypothetical protein